jgi:hypothetical protein
MNSCPAIFEPVRSDLWTTGMLLRMRETNSGVTIKQTCGEPFSEFLASSSKLLGRSSDSLYFSLCRNWQLSLHSGRPRSVQQGISSANSKCRTSVITCSCTGTGFQSTIRKEESCLSVRWLPSARNSSNSDRRISASIHL